MQRPGVLVTVMSVLFGIELIAYCNGVRHGHLLLWVPIAGAAVAGMVGISLYAAVLRRRLR